MVASLKAQTSTPSPTSTPATTSTPSPSPWPTSTPYDVAICAFDKALTKAARDQAFRNRLTKSCETAKQAIEEIGNVTIPCDRLLVFFEPEAAPGKSIDREMLKKIAKDFQKSSGEFHNEKIHIFFLPPFNPSDTTTEHRYETYFLLGYDAWKPTSTSVRCKVP
jgi:hypothetical protein